MSKKSGNFFLASLFGALAGVVGGLLLAPKSGKETRNDIAKMAVSVSNSLKTEATETANRVKDIYGKATEEATDKYNNVKNAVAGKVAALKTTGEEINREKYTKVVDEVIEEFKSDFSTTKTGATKVATYLKKDWEKVKKALA